LGLWRTDTGRSVVRKRYRKQDQIDLDQGVRTLVFFLGIQYFSGNYDLKNVFENEIQNKMS
jgi:hypothetical protein